MLEKREIRNMAPPRRGRPPKGNSKNKASRSGSNGRGSGAGVASAARARKAKPTTLPLFEGLEPQVKPADRTLFTPEPPRERTVPAEIDKKKAEAKAEPVERAAAAGGPPSDSQTAPAPASEKAPAARKARSKVKKRTRRSTAQVMAEKQRSISVSEFFTKNRHLLGFDNPRRALLATVKEAVDNALDACEEAGILPDIEVIVIANGDNRCRVTVVDNGPGIVKSQIPRIFGQLLYGSKFHTLKQTRGQQGIGISAAGMYGQLTTGRPVLIISKTGPGRPAHYYEIQIDTQNNKPVVLKDNEVEWPDVESGTSVTIEFEGRYQKGRHSVDGYLEQTALANPHVSIRYTNPQGKKFEFSRITNELPTEPREIKPHPYGVELGALIQMLKEAKGKRLLKFLQSEFSRVSPRVATAVTDRAGLAEHAKCHLIKSDDVERLYAAIGQTKILAPPMNCVSPIGEELIQRSLEAQIKADFFVSKTRPPSVYRGNPFIVEAGIAYGGDRPADELVTLYRFANRVPLLYQKSACAITNAVASTIWRNYGLQQSRGALPTGPAVIFVHLASVWVPFTSESKEAIADYDEITREIRFALQECGRQLGAFIRRRKREAEASRKRSYIKQYIPHIGEALRDILDLSENQTTEVVETLSDVLERSRK